MKLELDRILDNADDTDGFMVAALVSRIRKLEEALKAAETALQWIDKPDHFEPDQYTQTACFQHRAYNALKEIEELKR